MSCVAFQMLYSYSSPDLTIIHFFVTLTLGGFGQKKGRIGFRTTFLHPDTVNAIDLFAKHHEKFIEKYS